MTAFKNCLTNLVTAEDGQGMVEYSLILALVSVVAIGVLTTMGTNIQGILTKAATALK